MSETELADPAPVKRVGNRFMPGCPKPPGAGRVKGTPNKGRSFTVAQIVETADPIAFLCGVINNQPFQGEPDPETGQPTTIYPTFADRLAAAKVLAAKVLPDLKAVSVESHGNVVHLQMNLAPSSAAAVMLPGSKESE